MRNIFILIKRSFPLNVLTVAKNQRQIRVGGDKSYCNLRIRSRELAYAVFDASDRPKNDSPREMPSLNRCESAILIRLTGAGFKIAQMLLGGV